MGPRGCDQRCIRLAGGEPNCRSRIREQFVPSPLQSGSFAPAVGANSHARKVVYRPGAAALSVCDGLQQTSGPHWLQCSDTPRRGSERAGRVQGEGTLRTLAHARLVYAGSRGGTFQPLLQRATIYRRPGQKWLSVKRIHIIGGGLAGLSGGVARRQKNVPVPGGEPNPYPRHKVCGEFVSGHGLEVLSAL